jgi:hypothetical protein
MQHVGKHGRKYRRNKDCCTIINAAVPFKPIENVRGFVKGYAVRIVVERN